VSLLPSLAAAASGALISACFLRFWLFPLAWIAFVPLLWALARADSRRHAMALGYVAGWITNLPAFYWLVYTIHVFGGFPIPLAALLYLLLTALTSLQFVLFAIAWRRCGWGPLGISAPLLWVSLEFLYPNLFPWRMAHCQLEVPLLLQVGDLTGPYGLSFAIVWVSSGVALLFQQPRRRAPLAAAAAMALAIVVYGLIRLPQIERAMAAAPTVRVALVQGNIGIKEKGNISYFEVNLEKYRQLSLAVQDEVDLIVWPETVNQNWVPAEAALLDPSENPFPDLRTHLIFGGLAYRHTGPRSADQFNSAFLMSAGGRIEARYDKRILMPFGEYIPGGSYFPAVYALSPETGHFTQGAGVQVFDIGGKAKVGQLICFEDIVAGMPRATTNAGAELLVTILNDAWYGNTAAPYQHQALALWRTIENRRYLLRGSNTGVTSIIDAAGRVVAEGGLFTAEVVRGDVHRLQIDSLYARVGDAFAWGVVAAAALLLWRRGRLGGPP
jgi:apolipoprotein N-acyltransferase